MSTGTVIIQRALQKIGAHSVVAPASDNAINNGVEVLNSMIAELQDDGIDMGCVPLKTAGAELSEPLGARNAIIAMLAVRLHPDHPGSQVSPELEKAVKRGIAFMNRQFRPVTIPRPVVRETLPLGAGNRRYIKGSRYFAEGQQIGAEDD